MSLIKKKIIKKSFIKTFIVPSLDESYFWLVFLWSIIRKNGSSGDFDGRKLLYRTQEEKCYNWFPSI